MINLLSRVYFIIFSIVLSFSILNGSEKYFEGVLTYSYSETVMMDKPATEVIYYIKYPWIKRVYISPINDLELTTLVNLSEKKSYQVFSHLLISEESLGDLEGKSKYAEYLKDSQVEVFHKRNGIQITSQDENVDIIVAENDDLYFPDFYDQFAFRFLLKTDFDELNYAPEQLYYKFGDLVCEYELQKVVRKDLDETIFDIPRKTAKKGWENRWEINPTAEP